MYRSLSTIFLCGFLFAGFDICSAQSSGATSGGDTIINHSFGSAANSGSSTSGSKLGMVTDAGTTTTNTFPLTGGAGIGTLSPATALEITGGIDEVFSGTEYSGRFSVGYTNYTCCGQAAQYILLAPQSSMTSGNPSAGLNGILYCYRGSTSTFNLNKAFRIDIQTAYSNTYADVMPLNSNGNAITLYSITYGGAPYIAVNAADISSYGYQISFQGFYWNNVNTTKPQLVLASACTNVTPFKTSQSVWGNLIFGSVAGNIGIGTQNPQSTLAVAGIITAKGVAVTQTNWSDFVFDSTYQCMPLGKVAEYTKEHKHLPDLPSAAEIEQKGLDLGAMEKLHMQKIEELTLYAIDADKRASRDEALVARQQALLDQMQAQLKAQQAEIDRLKAQSQAHL